MNVPRWLMTVAVLMSLSIGRALAGETATAVATITAGFVTGITVTSGGSGYTSEPSVTLSGGGGSGASGKAILVGDKVAVVVVLTAGSGYSTAPAVAIEAPPKPLGVKLEMVTKLTVDGPAGSKAQVESAASLSGPWTGWTNVPVGSEGTVLVDLSPGSAARFYRAVAEVNPARLVTLYNRNVTTADQIILGVGQQQRLAWLTNTGSIVSWGYLGLGADVFHNAGLLASVNNLDLIANSLVLSGTNSIEAGGRLTINAKTFDGSAGGSIWTPNLSLNVTDRFIVPAGRVLRISTTGVSLLSSALSNDLSGLSVVVSARGGESSTIEWPGLDRGDYVVGFVNNSAINALVLTVGESGRINIRSSGSGERALYTKRLELNGNFGINVTNKTFDSDGLASALNCGVSIRLYYAFLVVNGIEFSGPILDGALGGRLRLIRLRL